MATATKAKSKTKKKSSTKTPQVQVVFSTFDLADPVYRTIRSVPIADWTPITFADYHPRGGTPLRDATAQFIAHLGGLKKKGTVVIGCLADESGSMGGNEKSVVDGINEFVGGMTDVDVDPEADGKVLAVILTDGFENSSTEVDAPTLAKMISDCEADDWTFIYLGANQGAWDVGMSTGFSGTSSGSAMNFASTSGGTRSAMAYAGNVGMNYLSSNVATMDAMEASSLGTVQEDGTVLDSSGNKFNIDEAVKKAKEGTK